MKPVRIFDNGGKTFDRYTIIIGSDIYCMSHNADSPQGVNLYYGPVTPQVQKNMDTGYFGLEVQFDDLPQGVRRAIEGRRGNE